ncbi:hypothetical protein [Streptomyces sp. NPDC058694]|uniref:hypothetical protein n=1 Tax=Streptomyces sp. NPDC058694 TaxID=3346603 RepID=UPI00364DD10E
MRALNAIDEAVKVAIPDNGTEVDVDFAADGSEVFGLWRLRGYGLSLPELL